MLLFSGIFLFFVSILYIIAVFISFYNEKGHADIHRPSACLYHNDIPAVHLHQFFRHDRFH